MNIIKQSFLVVVFSLFLFSCGEKSEYISEESKVEGIDVYVETLDSSQLVRLLLIENIFNYNELSDFLNCSISSLQRIEEGKTIFSTRGEEAIKIAAKAMLKEKPKKRIKFYDKRGDIKKLIFLKVFDGELSDKRALKRFKTTIDLLWEELD